jgi:RNA 2',3'-cyclic 3'-phosphodiesterase
MARIFAALLLPDEVVASLEEALDGVRTAHPHLRWVHPARWHVTLEFLGECGPHEVDRQLRRWARRAARCPELHLRVEGAGTFPAKAWMARVLWMGLAGDVDAWSKLAGYQQEPHLTIARTRERSDLTNLVAELSRYTGPQWVADEVALVESRLRPSSGPRYQPLERFALEGSVAAAAE